MAEDSEYPTHLYKSTYNNLLKGRAQEVACMFDKQDSACTFQQLRDHVEGLLSKIQDHTAKKRFNNHPRGPKQTFIDWSAELSTMAFSAYGESDDPWSPSHIQEMVLETMLRNTKGPLGKELRRRFPKTVDECVNYARNLEAEGYSEEDTQVVSYVRPAQHPSSRGAFRGRGTPIGRGGSIRGVPAYGYYNSASAGRGGAGPRFTNNINSGRETRVCHYCKKPGHLQVDCFTKRNAEQNQASRQNNNNRGRGRGRGGGARGRGGRVNAINHANDNDGNDANPANNPP